LADGDDGEFLGGLAGGCQSDSFGHGPRDTISFARVAEGKTLSGGGVGDLRSVLLGMLGAIERGAKAVVESVEGVRTLARNGTEWGRVAKQLPCGTGGNFCAKA
jgi:hypothetical protein